MAAQAIQWKPTDEQVAIALEWLKRKATERGSMENLPFREMCEHYIDQWGLSELGDRPAVITRMAEALRNKWRCAVQKCTRKNERLEPPAGGPHLLSIHLFYLPACTARLNTTCPPFAFFWTHKQ